jgi:hypothetical protein
VWNADKFEIRTLLKRDGKAAGEFPLAYAGRASQFQAELPIKNIGVYELIVFAFDPSNGNTGLDKATFIIK